jgi:hypothetical protein
MWWHGWDRQKDWDEIAGSLICGHLIECAAYVCGKEHCEQPLLKMLTDNSGGYFSGFKRLMDKCENFGFPIAMLESDGSCVITKEQNGTGGEVSFSLPRRPSTVSSPLTTHLNRSQLAL